MATIHEKYKIQLGGSSISPVESANLVIKTYGKGAGEALRVVNELQEEAQGQLGTLAVVSMERVAE